MPSRHWQWRSVGDPKVCSVLRCDRGAHAFTEGLAGVPEAALLQAASQAAAAGEGTNGKRQTYTMLLWQRG